MTKEYPTYGSEEYVEQNDCHRTPLKEYKRGEPISVCFGPSEQILTTMEEATAIHIKRFGKKPHPRASLETILSKLNKD